MRTAGSAICNELMCSSTCPGDGMSRFHVMAASTLDSSLPLEGSRKSLSAPETNAVHRIDPPTRIGYETAQ